MPVARPSRCRWSDCAGRCIDSGGPFVPRVSIRRDIDRTLAAADQTSRALAEQLRARAISLERWQREMRALVKATHLANAAAARGGWAQLTPADLGRVGQIVRGEYAYLQRFATDIAAGRAFLDGRFLRRVELYVEAGRKTFHAIERAEMRARGFDEEKNLLGAADHCAGCLAATAAGWAPIGSLAPIGTRDCLARCRCRLVYRNGVTGQWAA